MFPSRDDEELVEVTTFPEKPEPVNPMHAFQQTPGSFSPPIQQISSPSFEAGEPATTPPVEGAVSSPQFCSKCGTKRTGSKFCTDCGFRFE